MKSSPGRRSKRDLWLAGAAALMMIPSLALAVAPAGGGQVACLALVAAGMGLALVVG